MPLWHEFPEENEEVARQEYEAKNSWGEATPLDDPAFRIVRSKDLTLGPETLAAELKGIRFRWLIAIPFAIAAGFLVHWFSFWMSCAACGVMVVLSIGSRLKTGKPIESRRYINWFAKLFAVFFITALVPTRLTAATIASAITLGIFIKYSRRILDFHHQWIFAGPGMPTEEWVRYRDKWTAAPSHLILASILLLMIVLPAIHSVTLGLIVVPTVCAGVIGITLGARNGETIRMAEPSAPTSGLRRLRTALRFARLTQLYFAGYPDSDTNEHWNAPDRQAERRWMLGLLWGSMTVTTAIAFSYCIPYEIFGAWFQPGFVWTVPPVHHEQPFEWLSLPLVMMMTARFPYLGAIAIGVVFLILLPRLILVAAYLPALLQAQDVAVEANSLYRVDPQDIKGEHETHFEWFCRQMWKSEGAFEEGERLER